MNTFTTPQGDAVKSPAIPTPSSNSTTSPKNIDINTVYMFLEELKVSFEKGQAKQSDGSQVQTEVVNPKAFQKILAEELPKFSIQVEGPTLDYSKIPKPKDYTQSFTDLGKKIESRDSGTAKEIGKLSTAIGKLEDTVKTANATPKVQKVEKTVKLDIDSWKCLGCVICSFIISIFLGVWIFLQYDEIDQYKDTDLKYRLIQMNGSVSSVGLDSIEVWFQDPERVKNFNKMVTEYEQRMDKLRRSTLERDRLNSEINELNSQNNSNKR